MTVKRIKKPGTALIALAIIASSLSISQAALAEEGAETNPEAGKQLWYQDFDGRSCTSCHGQSPKELGKHQKTGRQIEPMALSVNPERFSDPAKTEKWFRRNCRWTLGRECTSDEKANILAWLKQQ